jgi:hypothetical protein
MKRIFLALALLSGCTADEKENKPENKESVICVDSLRISRDFSRYFLDGKISDKERIEILNNCHYKTRINLVQGYHWHPMVPQVQDLSGQWQTIDNRIFPELVQNRIEEIWRRLRV